MLRIGTVVLYCITQSCTTRPIVLPTSLGWAVTYIAWIAQVTNMGPILDIFSISKV